ncbi:hypothetical protein QCE63_17440 [Caballeronia sp. LZ065]|uniref:hypothetical protein n=1 Tax=Caballeronia sp. LZ065 TaxID=3038571 RepID=UPI00285CBBA2|nr:hypothetical protein [Caballeronia sp. LZ065]MDR5781196.1 hypothetical protein [Caballeronia sp. LZ065]
MSTSSQKPTPEESPGRDETFETDISETDDEGTTVREAEVRKDDLSETHREDGAGDKS